MKKTCAASGQPFTIDDSALQFYSKLGVPPPSLSPRERLRRRFAYRHGGPLHRTKCDGTGQTIVSIYSEQRDFPVFEQKYWWSDNWNAADYGRDYDFSRPFFSQFADLYRAVPHLSLLNTNCENAYYTSHALNVRNGYLLFGAADTEDSMYGYFIIKCKDVLDSFSLHGCELCYDGVSSVGCYNCISFCNCRNCSESVLLENCQGCSNCIGCVGLKGKSYHVLNQPLSKSAYQQFKAGLKLSSAGGLEELKQRFTQLKDSLPRIAAHLYNSEDCSGDLLINCKNCYDCFDLSDSEDCRYMAFAGNSAGSFDCSYNGGGGVRFCYECVSTLSESSRFNAVVWHGNEIDYSMECHSSSNLFGCVGLRRAEYSILNRSYPKAEYQALRSRIIDAMKQNGEWGEMFPISLSPFPYNDSIAQLFFPLTEAEAGIRGYRWRDDSEPAPAAADLYTPPADITAVPDEILNKSLICEKSGRPYKINRQELDFYRRMGIPVPRLAPPERHRLRLDSRHHFALYPRNSSLGGTSLLSIYPEQEASNVIAQAEWDGF